MLCESNRCDYAQGKVTASKATCTQIVWPFPQLPAPLWKPGTNSAESLCGLSQSRWSQDSVHLGVQMVLQSSGPYHTLWKELEGSPNQKSLQVRRGPREEYWELIACPNQYPTEFSPYLPMLLVASLPLIALIIIFVPMTPPFWVSNHGLSSHVQNHVTVGLPVILTLISHWMELATFSTLAPPRASWTSGIVIRS